MLRLREAADEVLEEEGPGHGTAGVDGFATGRLAQPVCRRGAGGQLATSPTLQGLREALVHQCGRPALQ